MAWREQELQVYEKWLEIEPDSCEAQHMVAAASGRDVPARASDAYVQRTLISLPTASIRYCRGWNTVHRSCWSTWLPGL